MSLRVIVYVEGPSDKLAMYALLRPLIDVKGQQGVAVDFVEAPVGDKKKSLLTKVPRRAASILANDPDAIVVAMPDLYPKNKAFPHETAADLAAGIQDAFIQSLGAQRGRMTTLDQDRFRTFCFKHDMEALILASEESLQSRLQTRNLKREWHIPVEDQNHDAPPKRIVEQLFQRHGERYKDTVDAPVILGSSNYETIAERCPQCFRPFVDFLESLTA
jgi:Domain of unknown function (DUF4276)